MNSNTIDIEGIEAIKLDLKRRHKEAFDEQLAISIINAAKEKIEVKKQWSNTTLILFFAAASQFIRSWTPPISVADFERKSRNKDQGADKT